MSTTGSFSLWGTVISAVVATVVGSIYLYRRSASKKFSAQKSSSRSKTSKIAATTNAKSAPQDPSKDVWADRRQKGISPASTSGAAKRATKGKPFGSSYYYAHNNSNSKGGYADGLRMEDYTMNGPRLLSKTSSGESLPVEPVEPEEEEDELPIVEEVPSATPTDDPTPLTNTTAAPVRYIPISSYQWDDPGDRSTGIADIRIDKLPSPKSGPGKGQQILLPWNSINVDQVTADFVPLDETETYTNEKAKGLNVLVHTKPSKNSSEATVVYQLQFRKLYGDAASVKAVVKSKRLIVRLQKPTYGAWDASNRKAWPRPYA